MPRYIFECDKCKRIFGVEMNLATYELHKGRPPCRYSTKGNRHKMKQVLTPIPFRVR